MPEGVRADARTCGSRCRKRLHRFAQQIALLERSRQPLRLAVADPPYPGRAHLYRRHKDYGGEVNLDELLDHLVTFDGWALATSAYPGLPEVLSRTKARGLDVGVGAWVRGERPQPRARVLATWEAVVYSSARPLVLEDPPNDAMIFNARPRLGDPDRVVGAKPAAWWSWVFSLVGARADDEFTDLFPGSGGGARAWALAGRGETSAEECSSA